MDFYITHSNGSKESNPPLSVLSSLLSELDWAGLGHGDVSLTHESAWRISVSRFRVTTWEHLERGGLRYLRDASREKILKLWTKLAHGDIQGIESEAWTSPAPENSDGRRESCGQAGHATCRGTQPTGTPCQGQNVSTSFQKI